MNNKLLRNTLLLFTITVSQVIVPQINKYSYSVISNINKGYEEGALGYFPPSGGMINGPMFLTSSNNGNIIITDSVNKRINIYNTNFEFMNSIKEETNGNSSIAYKLIIFKDYIIYYDLSSGLGGMTNNGKQFFLYKTNLLPDEIRHHYSFFKFNDFTLFYNRVSSNYFNIIDKEGNWIKGNEAKDIVDKTIKPYRDDILIQINELALKFFDSRKIVIHENQILSGVFEDHRDFYRFLKSEYNPKLSDININDKSDDIPNYRNMRFKYYDSFGNSYWQCNTNAGRTIFILSKFGEIVDIIDISYAKKNSMSFGPVSPTGIIYFFKYNKDKKAFEFYTLDR